MNNGRNNKDHINEQKRLYKNSVNIWPFDNCKTSNKSVFVEIFPTYYFRLSSVKPDKNIGYTLKNINKGLTFLILNPLKKFCNQRS